MKDSGKVVHIYKMDTKYTSYMWDPLAWRSLNWKWRLRNVHLSRLQIDNWTNNAKNINFKCQITNYNEGMTPTSIYPSMVGICWQWAWCEFGEVGCLPEWVHFALFLNHQIWNMPFAQGSIVRKGVLTKCCSFSENWATSHIQRIYKGQNSENTFWAITF